MAEVFVSFGWMLFLGWSGAGLYQLCDGLGDWFSNDSNPLSDVHTPFQG